MNHNQEKSSESRMRVFSVSVISRKCRTTSVTPISSDVNNSFIQRIRFSLYFIFNSPKLTWFQIFAINSHATNNFPRILYFGLELKRCHQQLNPLTIIHKLSPTSSHRYHNFANITVTKLGYIDVGDECWRRKVLVTTIRC